MFEGKTQHISENMLCTGKGKVGLEKVACYLYAGLSK